MQYTSGYMCISFVNIQISTRRFVNCENWLNLFLKVHPKKLICTKTY